MTRRLGTPLAANNTAASNAAFLKSKASPACGMVRMSRIGQAREESPRASRTPVQECVQVNARDGIISRHREGLARPGSGPPLASATQTMTLIVVPNEWLTRRVVAN